MSARLKAGHAIGSMKSITAPSRARSARLPSAPPRISPTGSHRKRTWLLRAKYASSAAEGERDRRHEERPAVGQRPEGHALVAHVREVEAEEDVHLLAALERRDGDRLRHLVREDRQARDGGRARERSRVHPRIRSPTIPPTISSTNVATIGLRSSAAGTQPRHRDEAPEEVQVRVGHVVHEGQERAEPRVVRDRPEPAQDDPDEDQDEVDQDAACRRSPRCRRGRSRAGASITGSPPRPRPRRTPRGRRRPRARPCRAP